MPLTSRSALQSFLAAHLRVSTGSRATSRSKGQGRRVALQPELPFFWKIYIGAGELDASD